MAQFLFRLEGVRGRSMMVFDRKCIISTKPGMGSFITGNVTDGDKTIFFKDVVAVQFKRSGSLIGYLQLETSSAQMNNQGSNMFSENTFTFQHGVNGVTNEQMEAVYHQLCDIIETIKYGDVSGTPASAPQLPVQAPVQQAPVAAAPAGLNCPNCGVENPSDSKFCVGCGSPLA